MSFDEQGYTRDINDVQAAERQRINAWRKLCGRADDAPLTGMAISGGGIRSAAFALGVLQSLDVDLSPDQRLILPENDRRISGLTRIDYLSTVSGGGYIGTALSVGMGHADGAFPFSTGSNDRSDSPALGHMRDYSRYLIPNGLTDLVADLTVVARGLLANLALVLGLVLLFAGLTRLFNPNSAALLANDIAGYDGPLGHWLDDHFGSAGYSKLLLLLYLSILAASAIYRGVGWGHKDEFTNWWHRSYFAIALLLALVIAVEIQPVILLWLEESHDTFAPVGMTSLTLWGAPLFAGLTALLKSPVGTWLAKAKDEIGKLAAVKRALLALLPLVISLCLIAVIWAAYLMLTYWMDPCFKGSRPAFLNPLLPANPTEMTYVAGWFVGVGLVLILFFGALPSYFAPNANSLHRLYRDRLTEGFVAPFTDDSSGNLNFLALKDQKGPLHLINAAVNLQSSTALNKRGRNADNFIFSPVCCGSQATGYLATEQAQTLSDFPDVATAMAISGAAVSTNMGKQSIPGLGPALALLNIRLGYWMGNPLQKSPAFAKGQSRMQRIFGSWLYFLWEALGKIDEYLPRIYLTDGGHIENLGLYTLLQRRCQTIIVIDAECDQGFGFASLIDLQRYARIDLGIRLYLPWQQIAKGGPHLALGEIEYDAATKGTILYIKASLNGDENDYITEYKRKNPAFPQESTGDQFFSEEQFEAYRALGFHCAHGAFSGKAPFVFAPAVPRKPPGLKGLF